MSMRINERIPEHIVFIIKNNAYGPFIFVVY